MVWSFIAPKRAIGSQSLLSFPHSQSCNAMSLPHRMRASNSSPNVLISSAFESAHPAAPSLSSASQKCLRPQILQMCMAEPEPSCLKDLGQVAFAVQHLCFLVQLAMALPGGVVHDYFSVQVALQQGHLRSLCLELWSSGALPTASLYGLHKQCVAWTCACALA